VSTSEADLALLLLRRGDLTAAEPLFRDAHAINLKVLGEDHPNTGASWNNLGLLLLGKGDYTGAEPMFRQALAIRRKHFGPRHPSLWANKVNLATALIEQQRYDEATVLLNDGLAMVATTTGVRQDAAITRLSFQLARVHLARGDAAAAETLLRDVLKRQQATLPADDWLIAATRSGLGAALIEQKQLDEAERLLTEASAVLQDVPGRQGREASATRERLAALAQARSGAAR
jgi:tetratricopeptide (TPR) repeat protein